MADRLKTNIEVPDFDLIRPVGSGGFGQVWLATNRTTGKLRAVKVIPLEQTAQGKGDRSNLPERPEGGHRRAALVGAQIAPVPFSAATREISSLVRLEANVRCQHPNLLQIHHVGKTASHLFYVMDPADDASGGPASERIEYRPATLQSWLNEREEDSPIGAANSGDRPGEVVDAAKIGTVPLAAEACWELARQLLAGLAALHAAGMVHRDVKPANCLFVGGQLKLADFGLLTEAHPLVSRLGTQKYMPPDGRMDMRADVYAAGLVIYEIISGLPVDEFPRLGARAQQVSASPMLAALLRLVLRACEREPEKRFADARAMLAELERPTAAERRWPRRRLLAVVLTAGVLAAGGLSWWMFVPQRVAVSFVTRPAFEAKIYLDGNLLVDSEGKPYATPCTVDGLSAGTHRVAFQCEGREMSKAEEYDFSRTGQIVCEIAPP
jgi:eukaryotic-like serine/threonine-protein kinase